MKAAPTKRLQRILRRFWTEPIRAEPLALMRICAGFSILVSALVSIAPNLHLWWFADGFVPTEVTEHYLNNYNRFSVLKTIHSPAAVTGVFVVWMLSLVGVTCGCLTRLSCAVAWLLALSFHNKGVWVVNGGDDVANELLFYLTIAPCGATCSWDAFRRRRRAKRRGLPVLESPTIAPWSVRLIQIQLVILYLMNGINKLDLSQTNDYVTGEAVYWVLNDLTLTRWSYNNVPVPMGICKLLTWGTILFELSIPLLVLTQRTRRLALWIGVAFHVGIMFTMDISWFGQNTMCFYPAFLSTSAACWFLSRIPGTKSGVCVDIPNRQQP